MAAAQVFIEHEKNYVFDVLGHRDYESPALTAELRARRTVRIGLPIDYGCVAPLILASSRPVHLAPGGTFTFR